MPISDPRLHSLTNITGRLLRHPGAMGCIVQDGPDTYRPSNFTKALGTPSMSAGYLCMQVPVPISLSPSPPCPICLTLPRGNGLAEAIFRFNQYLKTTGYKEPTSLVDGPLQFAYKTRDNFFEHVQRHPPCDAQLNLHMGAYRQGRPSWMEPHFYPVQSRLIDGADEADSAPFLVDVGGGMGNDLDEFHTKHPVVPGQLILQDLPAVIQQIDGLDPVIERQPHDFFQEQPVKGRTSQG